MVHGATDGAKWCNDRALFYRANEVKSIKSYSYLFGTMLALEAIER
jgi:hypothetical protein